MNSQEYVKAWDQRVGEVTAHIKTNETTLKIENLLEGYNKATSMIDIINKIIIDYGCGGGLFGKHIIDQVRKYIGLDIAKRSINAAKANVTGKDCEFALIDPYKIISLSKFNADVLFCLSVIQHFPDEKYLDYFLSVLNESKINTLILQIKYHESNVFQKQPYKTTHEINLACWTNAKYLKEKLTNYKMIRKSREVENEYNYLRFDLK
jgi:2-polyprenyl-3-methyl-5-hydroxy-6-metoxy-1,4-benzoquinol methylase